jgi:hypothetical protein
VSIGKFGKLPKKHDARNLQLADYVAADAEIPPLHRAWSPARATWSMFGNDSVGCCTVAAAGHLMQAWTANEGVPFSPTTQQILDAYSAITGYEPDDPSTDRGATMLSVLKYWRNVGIAGHKIVAFAEVDPSDVRMLALAQVWFGGLYSGFILPASIYSQTIWSDITSPGRYGHAMAVGDRDPFSWTSVTWQELQRMTREFMACRGDEHYAVLSTDWTGPDEMAPNGLLLDELMYDLEVVTK